MDFNNAKVLELQSNKTKRLFVEMVHINNNDNSINIRSYDYI